MIDTDAARRAAPTARVGIIGGSGLYDLLDDPWWIEVATPFGAPSDRVALGVVAGREVAFLPRHGRTHATPPHRIPYRANVWALAALGVTSLVSSSAVGGLRGDYPPGAFVVPDQVLDRTSGREGTFYDGEAGGVMHLAAADPFDRTLREIVRTSLERADVPSRPTGTVVVIDGPRFSTRAESAAFAAQGGDIVNMTLAPETFLAAEAAIAVANLSFVTDSDSGVDAAPEDAVHADLVFRRLADARPVIRSVLLDAIAGIPVELVGTGFGPEARAALLERAPRGPHRDRARSAGR